VFESLHNHKPKRQKSPADEFEALAHSITSGDCSEYDTQRAESYLKAAHESGGKSRFYHRQLPVWRDWFSHGRRLKRYRSVNRRPFNWRAVMK
jgi:hypothetical protein